MAAIKIGIKEALDVAKGADGLPERQLRLLNGVAEFVHVELSVVVTRWSDDDIQVVVEPREPMAVFVNLYQIHIPPTGLLLREPRRARHLDLIQEEIRTVLPGEAWTGEIHFAQGESYEPSAREGFEGAARDFDRLESLAHEAAVSRRSNGMRCPRAEQSMSSASRFSRVSVRFALITHQVAILR